MTNVYELLEEELATELGLSFEQAERVVAYLEDNGFLDYDTLKEIYDEDYE